MPNYTYQNLEDAVNGMVQKRIGNLFNKVNTLNRAVRFVIGDIDLRSTKRQYSVVPNLFDDIFDYGWPTDGKDLAIIDLAPQINRSSSSEIVLTTPEEFDRRKTYETNLVAIMDKDGIRKLRASIFLDDKTLVISPLDSLNSGGGIWSLYGDAINVVKDSDNFVKGSGSIKFDISGAGGTTAGIQNLSLNTFDITNYLSAGSVFLWVYITSPTNLTNYILRIYDNLGAYYQITATATNEGTAFVTGWNLLRFDFANRTTSGTPNPALCNGIIVYMTKTAGKINELSYRFDHLVAKRGAYYYLYYYSKYGWQNAAGTWIENSTATTDFLNCDTEEFELFTIKAAEFASQELQDWNNVKYYSALYEVVHNRTGKKWDYLMKYPSERKWLTNMVYDIGSIKGSADLGVEFRRRIED